MVMDDSKLETHKAYVLGDPPGTRGNDKVYEKMDAEYDDEEGIYEPIPGDTDDHIYDNDSIKDAIVLENTETKAPEDEDEVYM